MMEKTRFYSWKNGQLSKGCRQCVRGEKLVFFVTGLCSRNCWYCPLADTKKNKDVVYANEWKISRDRDIIKEAQLCDSKGAGITGGDPFMRIERTAKYIRMLKKRFGRNFHIHLYAPTELLTQAKLKKLYDAGLDEIRIHPVITDKKEWDKIEIVKEFDWDVGVEIPVIPDLENETRELIDYFKDKIDFLNLNELEISDTNANEILERGFKAKDELSYGVKGSEELALKLLRYCGDMNVHYCTCTLKDRIQLANRIKRRAKNVKEDFDIVNEDGTFLRGAIYLPDLKPGFGYHRKLEKINKERFIKKLKLIKKKFKFRTKVDEVKPRLLASVSDVEKYNGLIKKQKLIPAVVLEYPTWDELELEVDFV